MRHPIIHSFNLVDRSSVLVEKARKLRKKGELRKALVALREACLLSEDQAYLWCLYGVLLAEMGKQSDAESAIRQALWLRKRNGDEARMKTTQALLERVVRKAA